MSARPALRRYEGVVRRQRPGHARPRSLRRGPAATGSPGDRPSPPAIEGTLVADIVTHRGSRCAVGSRPGRSRYAQAAVEIVGGRPPSLPAAALDPRRTCTRTSAAAPSWWHAPRRSPAGPGPCPPAVRPHVVSVRTSFVTARRAARSASGCVTASASAPRRPLREPRRPLAVHRAGVCLGRTSRPASPPSGRNCHRRAGAAVTNLRPLGGEAGSVSGLADARGQAGQPPGHRGSACTSCPSRRGRGRCGRPRRRSSSPDAVDARTSTSPSSLGAE